MENTTKLELLFPVTVNGTVYQSLNIRRSKVKDRLAVSKLNLSDEEREIRLLSNLCEVAPEVLQELDEKDYQALQRAYLDFSNKGDLQEAVITLSHITHWSLSEILDLDEEDFVGWYEKAVKFYESINNG